MAETYNDQNQLALSILCIAILVGSAVLYAKVGTSNGYLDDPSKNDTNQTNDEVAQGVNTTKTSAKRATVIKPQPVCPIPDKALELSGLCVQFVFEQHTCKPEDVTNLDKHKIPKYYHRSAKNNSNNNETQSKNAIVNYIIAILLLTSLGAALLEFYKARVSPNPSENEKKTALNRKCSLADLTVLKHHRKELVRRESSVLEHNIAEEDVPQGDRRCSFTGFHTPASGNSSPVRLRKASVTVELGRRVSVINEAERKLSICTDREEWRRRSLAGEDSPERKIHHSRLVHRH